MAAKWARSERNAVGRGRENTWFRAGTSIAEETAISFRLSAISRSMWVSCDKRFLSGNGIGDQNSPCGFWSLISEQVQASLGYWNISPIPRFRVSERLGY